jgi:4'-phosphopantetheinyl transferase
MSSAAQNAWERGPPCPTLGRGAVHLWRADLEAISDELCNLLCDEELARAGRMLGERDRRLWKRSHGLLRVLLARYTRREPRSLRLAAGPHGKPSLVQEPHHTLPAKRSTARAPSLFFNMSHSGALALYAFSSTSEVGVDVEVAGRPVDAVALARRVFGADEARRLEGLEPGARQSEFRRAWVCYEAELKCLGVGLGGERAGAAPRPWIAQLELGGDADGALACVHEPRELACWGWS